MHAVIGKAGVVYQIPQAGLIGKKLVVFLKNSELGHAVFGLYVNAKVGIGAVFFDVHGPENTARIYTSRLRSRQKPAKKEKKRSKKHAIWLKPKKAIFYKDTKLVPLRPPGLIKVEGLKTED